MNFKEWVRELKKRKDLCPRILVPVLSFALTLFLFWLVFYVNGIVFTENADPNGLTGVISDSKSQYVAFYRYLRRFFQGDGEGIFYSLEKMFGGNMMSLFGYYLISPYNLLLAIFPDLPVYTCMMWIQALKVATAGLCAGIYLSCRPSSQGNGLVNVAFSIAYGLCSYVFGLSWCLFWLDGFAFLPLVALGIESIVKRKSALLYATSLCYVLICSWYIGFMVCVFSVIWFFCHFFADFHLGADREYSLTKASADRWKPVGTFCLASVGALICALPYVFSVTYILDGGKEGFDGLAYGFRLPWAVLRNFMAGTFFDFTESMMYNDSRSFIGIYVGGAVMVFASLYFFSSSYSIKERIYSAIPPLFYFLCFIILGLDTLMHGAAIPTWFPSRYAFCFTFILSSLAGDGFAGLKKTYRFSFLVPCVIWVILYLSTYLYFKQADSDYLPDVPTTLIWFACVAIALIVRFEQPFLDFVRRRVGRGTAAAFSASLSALLCCGVVLCSGFGLYLKGDEIVGSNVENDKYATVDQMESGEYFQKDVDLIKEYAGDNVYRMENTFIAMPTDNVNDNDPIYYGFNGLSHFSSADKKSSMDFAKLMGFFYNGYATRFSYGSTLSIESFLGLKYILDDKSNHCFNLQPFLSPIEELDTGDGVDFYQNPYALPLVFAADSDCRRSIQTYWSGATFENDPENQITYWYNQFEVQNVLWNQLVGVEYSEDLPVLDKIEFTYEGADDSGYQDPNASSTMIASDGITRTEVQVWSKDGKSRALPSFDISSGSTLTYLIHSDPARPLYWYFKDLYLGSDEVSYVMDGRTVVNNTYHYDGIVSFPQNSSGEHVFTLKFHTDKKNVQIRDGFYQDNLANLKKITDRLKENSVKDTLRSESSDRFVGTLTLTADHPDSLIVTIPNETGLSVRIDGEKKEISTGLNLFVTCDISSLEPGDHEIIIEYKDQMFFLGYAFAGLTLIVALLYVGGTLCRNRLSLRRRFRLFLYVREWRERIKMK